VSRSNSPTNVTPRGYAAFGNQISLLGYRGSGVCLLEANGWKGALLTRGGYDALRKQRSGFVPALFFLVFPPVSDSSILGVERVLVAAGKTYPILGRSDGNNAMM